MITVAQGWTSVERLVKNINDVSESARIEFANIVDEQIRDEIASVAPERLLTTTNISVSPNVDTYSLPADFEDTKESGAGFYRLDNNGNVSRKLARTSLDSQVEGYYISGSDVVFTPTPQNSFTVTLKYLPERTEMTSTSDNFSVPNGIKYKELVRQGLLVQYYLFKRRFDLKQLAEADYAALIQDLQDNIKTIPNVQNVQDISASY